MKTKQVKSLVVSCVLALILLLLTIQFVSASPEPGQAEQSVAAAPLPSSTKSGLQVPLQQAGALTATVQAASAATVVFKTQNGATVNNIPPQTFNLPHLILYQDGNLTREVSRTLDIVVENVEVPPGITVTVEITISTQHGDPDLGGDPLAPFIPVWHGVQTCTVDISEPVPWLFDVPFSWLAQLEVAR